MQIIFLVYFGGERFVQLRSNLVMVLLFLMATAIALATLKLMAFAAKYKINK